MALGQKPPAPPKSLAGFEHVNRYWDPQQGTFAAKILPGEYYVTYHEEIIVTVLGSCVSACIRDPLFNIGGMNHFMLPSSRNDNGRWGDEGVNESTRYGNFAIERLINDIVKHGGNRKNLEIKIFGGGRILAQMTDIGQRNIEFVQEYIKVEGLKLAAQDVGDVFPRKVQYFPKTGKVRVMKLRAIHNETIVAREKAYRQELETKPVDGGIELF